MFKRDELKTLYIHCPQMIKDHRMYSNGEVIKFKNNINSVRSVNYVNEGILYNEHALVHIATRSLKNAIFKSERIHDNQVSKKNIINKLELESESVFINLNAAISFDMLKLLMNTVGYKVKFPLKCMKLPEAQIIVDDFLRIQSKRVNLECVDNEEEYYRLYPSILNNVRVREIVNKVSTGFNHLFIEP